MRKKIIQLTGNLDLQQLKQSMSQPHPQYCLDESLYPSIRSACETVMAVVQKSKPVYGINTGFGALATVAINADDLSDLQHRLILSHACGTGSFLDDTVVGLMLIIKSNALARGYSGVRVELIESLLALYNHEVYPCVPSKGSVGASGDLAPLAHLALPLIGQGQMRYRNKIISAAEGLKIAGIKPLILAPKEGLALVNGLQASTAVALWAFYKADILFQAAVIAGCLTQDAATGSDMPFDDRIHQTRGHAAQRDVAAMYHTFLKDSPIREAYRARLRVQDPYSLRCQPQVMGAILNQLQFVSDTLSVEINSVTDNPLIFSDDDVILTGGNFHGEMIAMAADNLAIAISEMGAISERRIALLMDSKQSGLPPFLVKDSGLNSGFMMAHVTASACASDNKALSHPHSVDSLPTSANQEDFVSMSMNAALRLHAMIDNTATILAVELLAACQGLEFHAPLTTTKALLPVVEYIRSLAAPYDFDRYFAPDIAVVKEKILAGDIRSVP